MQNIHFASIVSYEPEWFKYGGALEADGGPEVVVVGPPVLDEL